MRRSIHVSRQARIRAFSGGFRVSGSRFSTPRGSTTCVITDGVTPSLHVDDKHSRIKQDFKEGRALRTETVINNA